MQRKIKYIRLLSNFFVKKAKIISYSNILPSVSVIFRYLSSIITTYKYCTSISLNCLFFLLVIHKKYCNLFKILVYYKCKCYPYWVTPELCQTLHFTCRRLFCCLFHRWPVSKWLLVDINLHSTVHPSRGVKKWITAAPHQ